MRVGEEVIGIVELSPEPRTKQRFKETIWWLNGAKPRTYLSRRRSVRSASASSYVLMDISSATLSDLQSSEEQFLEF